MTSQIDTSRADTVEHAKAYFDSGRFEAELTALVAHPSESQNPAQTARLSSYLQDALVPRLTQTGFACQIYDNPQGGPFLIARRVEDEALPTILHYGHGDVVHGQSSAWQKGLSPFTLTRVGDHLYGRGTADNKGQHLINIAALEAVLAARGKLGFNVTWLFEMSEETGSPGLAEFCTTHRDELKADALIASDGPRLQPEMPTIFLGARGAMNFTLKVNLRDGAHHSGNWGGLLADPAMILAHTLCCITDVRGQITVPEWRPTSLTDDVSNAIRDLPVASETGPEIDGQWGEETLTPAERAFGWNSFAILAMSSGVPHAPVNAISGNAHATCQLRFVVGTDPDDVLPALRRHLDRHGFEQVQIIPDNNTTSRATRQSRDNPWVQLAEKSILETTGQTPHVLPNLAGSLPNECFTDTLGLPTIWIPHSYRGCCQHAPNEHMLAPLARQGLEIMAGLFWDIGVLGGP